MFVSLLSIADAVDSIGQDIHAHHYGGTEGGLEGRACGGVGSGQAVARLSELPCFPQRDRLVEGGDERLMHFLKN